ncbi:enhancer of polycomb-like protein [Nitzschia inconspicua]|uniref:Enhancer of polycomb-like protein n=1 Tax=Nitzschia inconspicua TaxID=303405 RepID=A0A9K3PX14_9STRA|nr:enhancer of polycomb-like protein [Nitzschia inconspicua]
MTNSGATNVPASESAGNGTQPVAALNVYKKVAIIRGSDDVLTYEDADGNVKTVTDLHLAAVQSTPLHRPKPKDDIPVPKIKTVETYEKDLAPDYGTPLSYVRYHRPTDQELRENLEYVADAEDEGWLLSNTKFGGSVPKSKDSVDKEKKDPDDSHRNNGDSKPSSLANSLSKITPLPLSMLEIMLDVLEKATGFDVIITLDQAEQLILQKLPQLYHMYPLKGKASVVVTIRQVVTEVYQYWVSKRGKLKRPLLRRFWPVTSLEDTNPHLVFRPREKEKYKLRKKRQNDMEAYRKMQQLKQDFSQVRLMLAMVKQREELSRSLVVLQKEWFEQKLYDAVDTSGLHRISKELDKQTLDELIQVEKHYDVREAGGSWRRKRGRRGTSQQGSLPGSLSASRNASPMPEDSLGVTFGPSMEGAMGVHRGTANAGTGSETLKRPLLIAGHNNGEPAPNFLQPLPTREKYATSWEGAVPHVTTVIDGRPVPTFRFRHRPRVGRGGRICIDRVPLETDPNVAPNTYYRAVGTPSRSLQPKERLLDLLPPQINKDRLSRRIEDICMSALREEYAAQELAASEALLPTAGVAGLPDPGENDGTAVVVKMKDWLNTDDQLWGEERFSCGPV